MTHNNNAKNRHRIRIAASGPVVDSPLLDCLKIKYASEDEALADLKKHRTHGHAYRCPHGAHWHASHYVRPRTKRRR